MQFIWWSSPNLCFLRHLTLFNFIMMTECKKSNIHPQTHIQCIPHTCDLLIPSSWNFMLCPFLKATDCTAVCFPHLLFWNVNIINKTLICFIKEKMNIVVFLLKHFIPLFSYQGDIFHPWLFVTITITTFWVVPYPTSIFSPCIKRISLFSWMVWSFSMNLRSITIPNTLLKSYTNLDTIYGVCHL